MKVNHDTITNMETIFTSKKKFHKNRAKLPFEEKIRIVIKLQQLANEISKRKKHQHTTLPVWKIG
ncbi:MAG: hypothetical protein KAT34_18910 [Candidatus Aminicenantes bacterium]|nr:hypothetical protein [Candidatus Aminicenantes bacterium]